MQKIKEKLLAHYHSMTKAAKYCLFITLALMLFLLAVAILIALLSVAVGEWDKMSRLIQEVLSCLLRCAAAGFSTTLIGDHLIRYANR